MNRPFSETYLGKLRAQVGNQLLQVPAFRIILEDSAGNILLQLRSDYKKWGLPGGHPEIGESITDCAKREVLEETGLKLGEIHCFGFSSDPSYEVTTYPNGDIIHTFALLFHSTEWAGILDDKNDESLELRFFEPKRLPEMLPNEKKSLEIFLESKRDGQFLVF